MTLSSQFKNDMRNFFLDLMLEDHGFLSRRKSKVAGPLMDTRNAGSACMPMAMWMTVQSEDRSITLLLA